MSHIIFNIILKVRVNKVNKLVFSSVGDPQEMKCVWDWEETLLLGH